MASRNFTNLAMKLAKGSINFETDTFYALLLDDQAIPTEADLDTWSFRSDVDIEHAATGNYTVGGFLCASTVEDPVDAVNDNVEITITPDVGNGNPVFSNATISSVGAIIFRQVGGDMATPATDDLISLVDFNALVTSTNDDYKVTFTTPLIISVNV